ATTSRLTPAVRPQKPAGSGYHQPAYAGRSPTKLVTVMIEELRPAVFLDRDGVLNRVFVRDGVTHPPATVEEFALLPGADGAVRRLHAAGYALVVVTNQPDVARGIQTREGVERIHEHLRAELPMLEVLTCFHDKDDDCACRKPKPGMVLEAVRRWRLDPHRSFVVGDRWSDVIAGQAAGCRTILVETPQSDRTRCQPDHCVRDLAEAAEWILTQKRGAKAHEAVC
ncbi:MAG: D-glycero-alpha-D-manno-heptose-1,7-bisphosphate 7-phosphatase, partial [Gemmataceae bacterium]